ncbi:MAG: NADH-quinone oxidoreductase subunit NuoG [Paracoccaceae bacterium]
MENNIRKIIIDDQEIGVNPAMTILQACEYINKEIPRFCYHERLSIAGNCRMCLVEVVGGPPKPMASCALQVKDLRPGPNGEPPVIKTNSKMVKKAREGVMEFLLINHPLDCPICDQGGECDLQDQALAYGVDFSRYIEPKRAVLDIDLGPLVETHMTRCISCTRCVRFVTEVAGIPEMGQIGRGENSEITSYLGKTLQSELQGNIIDLCPVGALTSKPYAFTARPWELTKTNCIDVMDALGSNIRIDSKGKKIMRITPRNHDGINEEWLSDKSRFIWDGLSKQRLDVPYVRNEEGRLKASSWNEAFEVIVKKVNKTSNILAIAGDLVNLETLFSAKELMGNLGGRTECRTFNTCIPPNDRALYAGTVPINAINESEVIFIIGSNPRIEAPVLNARIRSAWLKGTEVNLVGEYSHLTYGFNHLGSNLIELNKIIKSDNKFYKNKKVLVLLGQGIFCRTDGYEALEFIKKFKETLNAELISLHVAASRVGAMDLNFVSDSDYNSTVNWSDIILNIGMDEHDLPKDKFVIYQGSHGDRGANRADVILPGCAFSEESGIFVNTEGRSQLSLKACEKIGNARENWSIIRALSEQLNCTLEYNNLNQLRKKLFLEYPDFAALNEVKNNSWVKSSKYSKKCLQVNLKNVWNDHYLTNPIARSSDIMATLSKNQKQILNEKVKR